MGLDFLKQLSKLGISIKFQKGYEFTQFKKRDFQLNNKIHTKYRLLQLLLHQMRLNAHYKCPA